MFNQPVIMHPADALALAEERRLRLAAEMRAHRLARTTRHSRSGRILAALTGALTTFRAAPRFTRPQPGPADGGAAVSA